VYKFPCDFLFAFYGMVTISPAERCAVSLRQPSFLPICCSVDTEQLVIKAKHNVDWISRFTRLRDDTYLFTKSRLTSDRVWTPHVILRHKRKFHREG